MKESKPMKYLTLAFWGMLLCSHPTVSATDEEARPPGSPARHHVRRGSFSMQRPQKKEGATKEEIARQAAEALQQQLKIYSAIPPPLLNPNLRPHRPSTMGQLLRPCQIQKMPSRETNQNPPAKN